MVENAEKHRKMFRSVVITFTSPKVSVTASKQVPRREKMGPTPGVFEIISNQLSIS